MFYGPVDPTVEYEHFRHLADICDTSSPPHFAFWTILLCFSLALKEKDWPVTCGLRLCPCMVPLKTFQNSRLAVLESGNLQHGNLSMIIDYSSKQVWVLHSFVQRTCGFRKKSNTYVRLNIKPWQGNHRQSFADPWDLYTINIWPWRFAVATAAELSIKLWTSYAKSNDFSYGKVQIALPWFDTRESLRGE